MYCNKTSINTRTVESVLKICKIEGLPARQVRVLGFESPWQTVFASGSVLDVAIQSPVYVSDTSHVERVLNMITAFCEQSNPNWFSYTASYWTPNYRYSCERRGKIA